MSDLTITKGDDGRLKGMGEAGERAYAKWRKAVEALQPGQTLRFQWWMPRSPKHHGLFFAQMTTLHAMQEQFEDVERLRQWLTVGAGYCDFVPGTAWTKPTSPNCTPRSTSFCGPTTHASSFGHTCPTSRATRWSRR